MAQCDIDELLADAACFNGLTAQQLEVLIAQLLCEWLDTVP